MTAQINDVFNYRDQEFAIAGISSGELFDPHILGLEPIGACSACWRGYLAQFAVFNSRLVLEHLHVSLFTDTETFTHVTGPTINRLDPVEPEGDFNWFNNYYKDLNYPLEYSGGLLLADRFIDELYVHMGFHPAWKYKKVLELIFEGGVLQQEYDRSAKMSEIRRKCIYSGDHYNDDRIPASMEELSRSIEDAFDRSYDL